METQHDAVSVIEHALALRGFDRPGDVVERRHAGEVATMPGPSSKTLVEMELLRDTGKVLTPRRHLHDFVLAGGASSRLFPA
jgi:hypothetical protein